MGFEKSSENYFYVKRNYQFEGELFDFLIDAIESVYISKDITDLYIYDEKL